MLENYENTLNEAEEKSVVTSLNIVNFVLGAVYCIPMIAMFLVDIINKENLRTAFFEKFDTVLFLDFYILTIPAFVIGVITVIFDFLKLKHSTQTKKVFGLIFESVDMLVLVCLLASYFISSAW